MAEILDLTCTTRDGTCADLFEDVRVQHYNSEIFVDASASQQEIAIRNLSSPPTFFPQLSPKVSGIQSMGSSDRAQPHVQQQQQQQQQPADDAFVRHVKSDGTSGTKSRVLLDGSDLPVLRSVSDMFQGVDSAAHRAHNETAKLLHEISQLQNLQQDIDRLQAFFQGNGDVLPTVQQQQQEPQQQQQAQKWGDDWNQQGWNQQKDWSQQSQKPGKGEGKGAWPQFGKSQASQSQSQSQQAEVTQQAEHPAYPQEQPMEQQYEQQQGEQQQEQQQQQQQPEQDSNEPPAEGDASKGTFQPFKLMRPSAKNGLLGAPPKAASGAAAAPTSAASAAAQAGASAATAEHASESAELGTTGKAGAPRGRPPVAKPKPGTRPKASMPPPSEAAAKRQRVDPWAAQGAYSPEDAPMPEAAEQEYEDDRYWGHESTMKQDTPTVSKAGKGKPSVFVPKSATGGSSSSSGQGKGGNRLIEPSGSGSKKGGGAAADEDYDAYESLKPPRAVPKPPSSSSRPSTASRRQQNDDEGEPGTQPKSRGAAPLDNNNIIDDDDDGVGGRTDIGLGAKSAPTRRPGALDAGRADKASPSASRQASTAAEQKIDPDDGQAMTFEQVRQKYAKAYSERQIQKYWDTKMREKRDTARDEAASSVKRPRTSAAAPSSAAAAAAGPSSSFAWGPGGDSSSWGDQGNKDAESGAGYKASASSSWDSWNAGASGGKEESWSKSGESGADRWRSSKGSGKGQSEGKQGAAPKSREDDRWGSQKKGGGSSSYGYGDQAEAAAAEDYSAGGGAADARSGGGGGGVWGTPDTTDYQGVEEFSGWGAKGSGTNAGKDSGGKGSSASGGRLLRPVSTTTTVPRPRGKPAASW
mmetsp:Transcript_9503/g.20660  ORF Transcript_9503/g.20660 Transcript_9503/m.20660 type:complete len:863 (+) Transcript_9503:105-2693(+)